MRKCIDKSTKLLGLLRTQCVASAQKSYTQRMYLSCSHPTAWMLRSTASSGSAILDGVNASIGWDANQRFSIQVSIRLCSASFGTISHLVPAVRQSIHGAPRLSILHFFGEHTHLLCAVSPMSRIIDVSWRHEADSAFEVGGVATRRFPSRTPSLNSVSRKTAIP
jgi:hypothetical protein